MKKIVSLMILTALLSLTAVAQEKQTEHTLKLSAGQKSPAATLAEMSWMTGGWTGKALGGVVEEIWAAPAGGSMLGMFRLTQKGKPVFYELVTLVEENGSILFRLKHFNPNMTGWEEKDKTIEFKFIGKKDGLIHFDGMSFKLEGKDAFTVYLAIEYKDGTIKEEAFRYTRAVK
ncbi:MAG: DUF6265 family protein [Blastocatellia bacterium]